MKLLFLDIDGVLNGHEVLKDAGCCGIDVRCVQQLNRVLEATGCKLVLSSAWRYMIHGGAMTLDGFWYMLRTHGLTNRGLGNPFIGLTCPDEQCAFCGLSPGRRRKRKVFRVGRDGMTLVCSDCGLPSTRCDQIFRWLRENPGVRHYAVVDDLDLGFACRHRFVQTDGRRGLTRGKADRLIALLGKEPLP